MCEFIGVSFLLPFICLFLSSSPTVLMHLSSSTELYLCSRNLCLSYFQWCSKSFDVVHICLIRSAWGSFKKYVRWGGRGIEKRTKTNRGRGCTSMCVRSLKKKMLRFWKWSFIIILQFFLLIITAVWNTIMKDYNIWSYQWMGCDCFRQLFLLCTTFCSFLCTVHYFLCTFSAKMATYWL